MLTPKLLQAALSFSLLAFVVTKLPPTGLFNNGNYCFVSALVQVFYHMPDIFNSIVQNESENLIHITLASLMSRMSTQPGPHEIDLEFIPALDTVVTSGGKLIQAGKMGDAVDVYEYLVKKAMPWLEKEFFEFETMTWLEVAGVKYSVKRTTHNRAHVSVLEGPIHETVVGKYPEIIENVLVDPENVSKGDPAIMKELELEGITTKGYYPVTKRVSITKTPKIFVIQTTKPQTNDAPTIYDETFEVDGKLFNLQAGIIFTGMDGHFYTKSRVNFETNEWYILNDDTVALMEKPGDLGPNSNILFYVESGLLQQWIENDRQQVQNSIPIKTRTLSELFHTLGVGVDLVRILTTTEPK